MKLETLKALQGSIAKWEQKAVQPFGEVTIDPFDCPLCLIFNSDVADDFHGAVYCDRCPVRERTGQAYCVGSPCDAAAIALNEGMEPEFRVSARAEVAFLKDLLPLEARAPEDL